MVVSSAIKVLIVLVLIIFLAMIIAIVRLFKLINDTKKQAENMSESEIEQFAQESFEENSES